jgi:preprotein translocase subunit SecD
MPWGQNKAQVAASRSSLCAGALCLTASLSAALASGAGAQPAPGGYGCLSFHEVNATVAPEEAQRLGAPRGYKTYPQLRDPSDRLVLRESPITSSGEIVEADGIFDPQSHRSIVKVRFNRDAAGRLGPLPRPMSAGSWRSCSMAR